MFTLDLNKEWSMSLLGDASVYRVDVPTTMYQILLEHERIADPFIGENDKALTKLSDNDCLFVKHFSASEALLQEDDIELVFDGIDTISTVWLNGQRLLRTQNMHRTYRVKIKDELVIGDNELRVHLSSPTKYIQGMQSKDPLWGIADPIPGYEHIRKAHHMFGWDWGPQLPDMGIWRGVRIEAYEEGRIDDCYITQKHGENSVELEVCIDNTFFGDGVGHEYKVEVILKDDMGNEVTREETLAKTESNLRLEVNNPKLWWPNGYGEQPLYQLVITLLSDDKTLHRIEKRIGLRTMTMTREVDEWGESFDMTINGVRIFAMGADYIPEDVMICRMNRDRTKQLLIDCKKANFNHIRVWGGAFYPEDYFYDLCDELGLLVWQDFMFACGVYRLTKQFEENITAEFIDNIKRIRHHASLGLWCGNNEMEIALLEWGLPKDERLKKDYMAMYERLIPDVLAEYDPNTFYWPASPSSGGGFDDPNSEHRGDVHFWEVFHGNKHYKVFREHYFRFASEFGMQSFPDMKTIRAFSQPSERAIYGPVMENHNKCIGDINGNMKIMLNMSTEFGLPNNLEDIVYLSQVFQGETIRCAVEHMRRNRGQCMGSTYWQLNDNWPVASWSSIDVYGRWKAMHYMVKRFYAPVHASAYEKGLEAFIHVSNERRVAFQGQLTWQIRHVDKGIIEEGEGIVSIESLSSKAMASMDIQPYVKCYGEERNIYVSYQLEDDNGERITSDILLFVAHKHFAFHQAKLSAKVLESHEGIAEIHITSEGMAKSVAIEFEHIDVLLSDNYFDLLPNETKVVYTETPIDDLSALRDEIHLRAVNSLSYI